MNMKRIGIIAMALAFFVVLTQCKKEQPTPANEGETVAISLEIKSNANTRIDVNTVTGEVTYGSGDKVYVASGGKYVGTLTHNGTNFGGTITNPTVGEPLHFYFLGNVEPEETLTVGYTTSCSVSISDQTQHMPVIEYAPSNETYDSGTTTFTAMLLNKCALVKFNVTTASDAPTCITGFNNKVSISFLENSFDYSKEGSGIIKLGAGSGEKYAILLPQEALEAGEVGSAYSEDITFKGTRGAVPALAENVYLTSGIGVLVATAFDFDDAYVDLGLPSGLLWATCNVGTNLPERYGVYFAWGETQMRDYYDWSTYQYCNGSFNTLTKYCNNSSYGYNGFTDDLTTLLPEDDAATANWGNGWRMPTKEEWEELMNNTTVTWTQLNGKNGRLFTASNGNSLFLPAAGYKLFNPNGSGSYGYYWSSSLNMDSPSDAWFFIFDSDEYGMYEGDGRHYGQFVRAVRSAL